MNAGMVQGAAMQPSIPIATAVALPTDYHMANAQGKVQGDWQNENLPVAIPIN